MQAHITINGVRTTRNYGTPKFFLDLIFLGAQVEISENGKVYNLNYEGDLERYKEDHKNEK